MWREDEESWIRLFVHSKKNKCFTEPPKKVPEMSKSVQRRRKSQKKDKNIYETFKDSSGVPRGRIFEGFVDIFIIFLRLSTPLDTFRHLRNLFWGFGKTLIFFRVYQNNKQEILYKTKMIRIVLQPLLLFY